MSRGSLKIKKNLCFIFGIDLIVFFLLTSPFPSD